MNTAYAGCSNSVVRALCRKSNLALLSYWKAFRLIFADAQKLLNETSNKTFYLMTLLLSKSGLEEESQLLRVLHKFIRP